MIPFLLSLLPLVFVEATAFTRIAMLGVFLGARERPIARGVALVAGTFACYMVLGLLFAFGLGAGFEKAGETFADRIYNPESIDYVLSLIIGVFLLLTARRIVRPDEKAGPANRAEDDSGGSGRVFKAFLLGFTMNFIVGPNTLCSFAAYNQILKSEFGSLTTFVIITGYNLLIISPLIVLIVISAGNRERAERLFNALRDFFSTWGRRLGPPLLIVIALIMIADSVGYFLGHPLLPTGTS